jgi:MFS family permease
LFPRLGIRDRNIWVIYAAIIMLGVAYGTSISVLAVHLDAHGIPKLAMGGLAAAFALGIVTLSIPAGLAIQRFGAKRTLATALAGYGFCVTSFPFFSTLTSLSVARFVDGACSVGVWVAAETALLARSDKENKGLVMSLYAIAVAVGYVIGPLLAAVIVPRSGTGATFVTAGAFAATAVAIVLFGLDRDTGTATHDGPGDPAEPRASARTVIWRVKTSCFGTFAYGYFQASVVLFLPLYLIENKHIEATKTIFITAFFAGGMLLMSTWAGRLGDRLGHLRIMRILATIGGLTVASFVFLPTFETMCVSVFVAGATLASISPVSLALQGVVTPRADLGRANAFYNTAYAAGMLLGPPVSGWLFTRWGGATMLLHLAALWGFFVFASLVFASDDPKHRAAAPQHATADA